MENYTGSYIGLGFVFQQKKQENLVESVLFLLKNFASKRYVLTQYYEKTDKSSESTQSVLNKIDIVMLFKSDNFTITFETIYNDKHMQILISNSSIEGFSAIQIDFHEESFVDCFTEQKKECLDFIENLAMDLYRFLPFEYAFCDSNAMFEHNPTFLKSDGYKEYSVVIIPVKNGLEIIRQHWEFDGFTERIPDLIGKFYVTIEEIQNKNNK